MPKVFSSDARTQPLPSTITVNPAIVIEGVVGTVVETEIVTGTVIETEIVTGTVENS